MLNKIWFFLLLIGIVYGFGKALYRTVRPAPQPAATAGAAGADASTMHGASADSAATDTGEATGESAAHPLRDTGQQLTQAALEAAETAVQLCISLIGMMALWLGMLRIARDAGLVDALAAALRPVTRRLFPDVPSGHPAEGAMLMNLSANMLGLGNAATPFGLKAMRELQALNPAQDTATNAMVMFLAINTSSVTLLPFTIIGLRAAAGSTSAARPLFATLCATIVSTTAAIVATLALSRRPRYAPAAGVGPTRAGSGRPSDRPADSPPSGSGD